MKRLFLTLTMITFIVLSFSSCSGLQQVSGVQSTSFVPDYVRVDANINDYDKSNEILNYRNDSIQSYLMRQKRRSRKRKIAIFLGKPFIWFLNHYSKAKISMC